MIPVVKSSCFASENLLQSLSNADSLRRLRVFNCFFTGLDVTEGQFLTTIPFEFVRANDFINKLCFKRSFMQMLLLSPRCIHIL